MFCSRACRLPYQVSINCSLRYSDLRTLHKFTAQMENTFFWLGAFWLDCFVIVNSRKSFRGAMFTSSHCSSSDVLSTPRWDTAQIFPTLCHFDAEPLPVVVYPSRSCTSLDSWRSPAAQLFCTNGALPCVAGTPGWADT
jgi:hypothetical protein